MQVQAENLFNIIHFMTMKFLFFHYLCFKNKWIEQIFNSVKVFSFYNSLPRWTTSFVEGYTCWKNIYSMAEKSLYFEYK